MAIALMARSIARASRAVEEAKTLSYPVTPNVPVSRPSHATCYPNDLAPTRPQVAGATQNGQESKPSGGTDFSNDPETQFVHSRRELVQVLARRHGVEVSDEVKRFFDAAEAGRYEEMQTILKSLWNQRNIEPGSHDFDSYWPVILQTAGTAEQVHLWPAQKLLDYGNTTLESLRPAWFMWAVLTLGSLSQCSSTKPAIVLTQNALADPSYLDYINDIYGDHIATLTQYDANTPSRITSLITRTG